MVYHQADHICIKGVPEGEERENGAERIFEEVIAENISNLMEDMNINTKEAQKTPSKTISKRSPPRHIIIKYLKDKDK